jgi:probable rRNA maturation factor
MSLSLTVQFASIVKTLPQRAQVRRWALAAHRAGTGAATIRYVDEKEARALNRDFRGKDYATNVLTFVHEFVLSPRGKSVARYHADIVICAPVIFREAREQKKSVHDHHAQMVIHGMLHAQGFDHEDNRDAVAMEGLEVQILHRFRIKNPYEFDE